MIEYLQTYLQTAFKTCGYEEDVKVIVSNRPDLCDYQCDDAFKIAKKNHVSPIEIGEKIVNYINNEKQDIFKTIEFIKPGFINMTLSDQVINQFIDKMFATPNYGIEVETKKTYFLDYGGPNIAKPLHVGHLRTAIIGESIKRIIQFVGNKTISDVHFGDYGLQIGEVIYGIKQDGLNLEDITLEYLEETYPKMSKLCKENEEILQICSQITKELQEGNTEYQTIWEKICEVSRKDIERIYNYLDVTFDLWEGESDAYAYIPTVTKLLEEKQLLIDSEGARVIDVKEENDKKEMPPLIYQKSNGAYLYGTTDIATIYERVTNYHSNYILYVTDARQSLHFEQVFRSCNKWGITKDITLEHLGYGTVNGSDGKPFKTRSGDTVKLDGLFDTVKEAFINSKESNQSMSEKDLNIIVNAIIKFADLQNNREKDYVFDPLKFSSVVGKTGPYILYSYLRMNKILKNENLTITTFDNTIYNNFDRDLRMNILQLENAVYSAYQERMPHYIAEYIYNLCVLSNIFYQNNHIVGLEEAKKQQWLLLIVRTNEVIKKMLSLLMIQIPSEM